MPVINQNAGGGAGTPSYPGLLVYAEDIIKAALRSIGAYSPGEQPTAPEMQDSLFALNRMMDAFQIQRLLIFQIARLVFTPATLKQTYTVGPGGDYNIPRPARISNVSVIQNNSFPQAIELALDMYDEQQWQNEIPVKNTSGSLPLVVWDDNAFPLRNLNFWPIPSLAGIQFALYCWQLLSQFADINFTLYSFPPGYLEAIVYNLAVRLAPEFPGDPEKLPQVAKLANDGLTLIKNFNRPSMKMACDPALVNPKQDLYNWLTDTPAGR